MAFGMLPEDGGGHHGKVKAVSRHPVMVKLSPTRRISSPLRAPAKARVPTR
jgi:hypothetical protein